MVEDSGSDLLLFVALQVSSERTSSRPKFFITISLRVTPLRTFIVLLFMKLLLRYQVTVGGGLPAKETYHRNCIRSNYMRYNNSFFLSFLVGETLGELISISRVAHLCVSRTYVYLWDLFEYSNDNYLPP